ncbi:hypothetical protein ACPDLO_001209 [Vibrio cholerae]
MPHKIVVIPFLLEAAAVLATFVHRNDIGLSMLMGMNSLAALLCFADAQSMTMERNENLIRNDLHIAKSYLIDVLPQ